MTQQVLFGMEELMFEEEEGEETSGKKMFFDAALLPDAPKRQFVANGAQTYVLHLVFPDFEKAQRALFALSLAERKSLPIGSKKGLINGIKSCKSDGRTFLEHWEEKLIPREDKSLVVSGKEKNGSKSNSNRKQKQIKSSNKKVVR